jgi:uncharacterized membrane protein YeiH
LLLVVLGAWGLHFFVAASAAKALEVTWVVALVALAAVVVAVVRGGWLRD